MGSERQIKPSENRAGDYHDRTQGDRRTNLALQLVDFDINDCRIRKPKHAEATAAIAQFIHERARQSRDPIAVTITGTTSGTGTSEADRLLSCRRASCAAMHVQSFLSPALRARVTFDTCGRGFSGAEPRGAGGERPDHRSVLISVHPRGKRPPPITAVPTWWGEETDGARAIPRRHRMAYGYAQQAELVLGQEELDALALELLTVGDEAELEQFLGRMVKRVSRAARKAGRAVGKAAKGVAKAAGTVGKLVAPVIGTAAKLASHSPLGSIARGTYGAISAVARGKNPLMGALDGVAGTPLMRGLVRAGGSILRGENVVKAAKQAVNAGISDVREAVQFAKMVAPFVPGIGTGVGAALGAADALAAGRPITEALIAGARSALPGGAIAQTAFDTAASLVKGERIDRAFLGAARNQLPPGPARAAFDTGVAVMQGKNLQNAVLAGAGQLLPASPYAADVLSFAGRAMSGENLGRAALSTAGKTVLRRAERHGGDIVASAQGRARRQLA